MQHQIALKQFLYKKEWKSCLRVKLKSSLKLKKKQQKQYKKIQQHKIEDDLQNSEDQFVLIPGKETHNREFIKLFKNTQTSYDGIFSRQEDFCWYMLKEREDGKDAVSIMLLERGVKIRIVVCNPENKKLPREVSRIFRNLNRKGNLRIKIATCTAPMFGIIDNKAIFMNIGPAHEWMEKPSLYSTNRCLVDMAKGYFEKIWQTSERELWGKELIKNE
ncbi:MAG: hypothetical protein N2235_23995 [Fischerella sp.]|nr:hypothetical protein [Fischerella sp.]